MDEFDEQLLEKILDTMEDCLDSIESIAKSMDDEQSIEDIIIVT